MLSNDHVLKECSSFWNIWNYLLCWKADNRIVSFSSRLLLKFHWRDSAVDWKPISGKSTFFINFIEINKECELNDIIHLVSSVGMVFLPLLVE